MGQSAWAGGRSRKSRSRAITPLFIAACLLGPSARLIRGRLDHGVICKSGSGFYCADSNASRPALPEQTHDTVPRVYPAGTDPAPNSGTLRP